MTVCTRGAAFGLEDHPAKRRDSRTGPSGLEAKYFFCLKRSDPQVKRSLSEALCGALLKRSAHNFSGGKNGKTHPFRQEGPGQDGRCQ